MDATQKKAAAAEWKGRHPEMGVACVRCAATGEEFYAVARDTSTWFNRHRFELEEGNHRNRRLQELWGAYGEAGFELSTVSDLDYDDPGEVSSGDLKELLELCLAENPQAKKL